MLKVRIDSLSRHIGMRFVPRVAAKYYPDTCAESLGCFLDVFALEPGCDCFVLDLCLLRSARSSTVRRVALVIPEFADR